MKNKLVIILLFLLVLGLPACGKDAPVVEVTATEPPAVEQAETATPQEAEQSEVSEAPKQEETPAEPIKEAQQEQGDETVRTEEHETEDENWYPLDNNDDEMIEVPVENVTVHVPDFSDDELEEMTEEEKKKHEEYLEMIEQITSVYEDIEVDKGNSGEVTPPVEEEPELYTPSPALSDAEVQKFVNDYLDNFESYVDISGWDESAIEKLDENIEIVRNNPPSSISRTIKAFQGGYTTKEDVEFEIWSFLEMGGYGSANIVVQ